MKRMWKWIGLGAAGIAIVLGVVFLLWQKAEDSPSRHPEADVAAFALADVAQQYRGNVSVDFERKRITGTLQVDVRNKTDIAQKAVYFHLYPNAFKEEERLRGENWDYTLGTERTPGWIDVANVRVNGKTSNHHVTETILEIPLTQWAAGEHVRIELDYTLQVPKNNSRLSYDEHSIWLGNWLPIVAEYDNEQWYLDPYYPIGDPFFSDIAHYELEIETPVGFRIASSGVEVGQPITVIGNRQRQTVSASLVRDFALVIMDDTYKAYHDTVNGITIHTWYRATDRSIVAHRLHKAGIASLTYFSDAYGAYPYAEYDIVRTGGFFGGMEYPGLVFVQGAYFEDNDPYGIVVVAHETAHQWWYGLVGNDEVREPWMDEGPADYSTLRFLLDRYKSIGQDIHRGKKRMLSFSSAYEREAEYVGNSVDLFTNWNSYGTLVYTKGSLMFYELEQAIGIEKMNRILQDYFELYHYHNARADDLIAVFTKHLGEQAKDYFAAWLQGGEAVFAP